SIRWKFSGPLSPRPPDTITVASLTSSFAPGFAATEATTALPLEAGAVTTSHARGASTAANTFGRVVAQKTGAELVSVAIALPASHGRAIVNESPCAESAVT